ncbi:MAG: cytochrome c oxidase subunit II [Shinella sp.]|nr:cytochrome c oxidase subunit II [Shinella sp.]
MKDDRATRPATYARFAPPGLICLLASGCRGAQSALDPAGEEAEAIHSLLVVTAVGGGIIWLLVVGLILYARRRDRPVLDVERAQKLISWGGVAFPTVILLALLSYALWKMPVARPWFDPGDAPMTVEVTGEQFWWRVRYLDQEGEPVFETANEILMPIGERVRFLLKAHDVIHSFWIPALGGKMDMIPGRTNVFSLKATRTGIYRGPCAEFCGSSHALMNLTARVLEPQAFREWFESRSAPAGRPAETEGQAAFLSHGCGACHSVRGTQARGQVGPDLTAFAKRERLGAGVAANTQENRVRFIRNPDGLKPGVRMPAFSMVPDSELEAIATYLGGLE